MSKVVDIADRLEKFNVIISRAWVKKNKLFTEAQSTANLKSRTQISELERWNKSKNMSVVTYMDELILSLKLLWVSAISELHSTVIVPSYFSDHASNQSRKYALRLETSFITRAPLPTRYQVHIPARSLGYLIYHGRFLLIIYHLPSLGVQSSIGENILFFLIRTLVPSTRSNKYSHFKYSIIKNPKKQQTNSCSTHAFLRFIHMWMFLVNNHATLYVQQAEMAWTLRGIMWSQARCYCN